MERTRHEGVYSLLRNYYGFPPHGQQPKYYTQRRQVFVPKATADAAQCLRPTSAFTKITTEALQEWIAGEQRRAELLARAEKELT